MILTFLKKLFGFKSEADISTVETPTNEDYLSRVQGELGAEEEYSMMNESKPPVPTPADLSESGK